MNRGTKRGGEEKGHYMSMTKLAWSIAMNSVDKNKITPKVTK